MGGADTREKVVSWGRDVAGDGVGRNCWELFVFSFFSFFYVLLSGGGAFHVHAVRRIAHSVVSRRRDDGWSQLAALCRNHPAPYAAAVPTHQA